MRHLVAWWWLWPLLTAVASVVYGRLNQFPRWHALFSFLAGIGIDIPKILDALRRLWSGEAPPALPLKPNSVSVEP